MDVLYKSFVDEGKKDGIPTQESMLKYLRDEGIWTEKEDKEVEDIKTVIERLVAGKRVIYLPSELERQNKEIEEHEQKYYAKRAQREKLLGLTCESFAEKKVNEHYIEQSFYWDGKFANQYLTEEASEKLSQREMQELVQCYNQEMEIVSDRNIKCVAIQDFFQIYWSLSTENLHHFFGKPICDLTYFQVKLGSYGRTFKNILEKAEGFPEEVRSDPDKLLDYVRTSENAKNRMEKASENTSEDKVGVGAVATSLIGAKTSDYKAVGIESDPGTVSLSSELKKAAAEGKKGLDMHQLMKMMGV